MGNHMLGAGLKGLFFLNSLLFLLFSLVFETGVMDVAWKISIFYLTSFIFLDFSCPVCVADVSKVGKEFRLFLHEPDPSLTSNLIISYLSCKKYDEVSISIHLYLFLFSCIFFMTSLFREVNNP